MPTCWPSASVGLGCDEVDTLLSEAFVLGDILMGTLDTTNTHVRDEGLSCEQLNADNYDN